MNHDIEWWKARATKRYREAQKLRATLERIEAALGEHANCWPDDWCKELADDIRRAIDREEPA